MNHGRILVICLTAVMLFVNPVLGAGQVAGAQSPPDPRVLFDKTYILPIAYFSPSSGITSLVGGETQLEIRITGPSQLTPGETFTLDVEFLTPDYDVPVRNQKWDLAAAQIALLLPDSTIELAGLPVQQLLIHTNGHAEWMQANPPTEFESVWLPLGAYILWEGVKLLIPVVDDALQGGVTLLDRLVTAADTVISVRDIASALQEKRPIPDEDLWQFYQFENTYDLYRIPDYIRKDAPGYVRAAKRYTISLRATALDTIMVYVDAASMLNQMRPDYTVHAKFDEQVIIGLPLAKLYGDGGAASAGQDGSPVDLESLLLTVDDIQGMRPCGDESTQYNTPMDSGQLVSLSEYTEDEKLAYGLPPKAAAFMQGGLEEWYLGTSQNDGAIVGQMIFRFADAEAAAAYFDSLRRGEDAKILGEMTWTSISADMKALPLASSPGDEALLFGDEANAVFYLVVRYNTDVMFMNIYTQDQRSCGLTPSPQVLEFLANQIELRVRPR